MNTEFYEQLNDLVDIHNNCTSNGEEIFCFDLIKKIVDGEVLKENINEEQRILAQKQLVESLEWFQIIGVTIEYQEELMKIIS
ncbi:MAG: hypothetical protein IKK33_06545 [Lachnospiraceae bacterium]|nr:hypothetical protein [Lachnospiraceae bacterium]